MELIQVACRLSSFSYTAFHTIHKFSVTSILDLVSFCLQTPPSPHLIHSLCSHSFFVSFHSSLHGMCVCVAIIWCNFIWDKIHILFRFTPFFYLVYDVCALAHVCTWKLDGFDSALLQMVRGFHLFVTNRQYAVLYV